MDILTNKQTYKAIVPKHKIWLPLLWVLLILIHPVTSKKIQANENKLLSGDILFLHTDRDLYIAGENLYFQIYHIDGIANEASGSMIYLVLQNQNGVLIKKLILRLNNHKFHGCIYLPDTLSTGSYQLITYTNQMRHPDQLHQKHRKAVFIANRFDEELESLSFSTSDSLILTVSPQARQMENKNEHSPTLKTDHSTYGRREKVELQIIPPSGADAMLHLSVTVAHHLSFLAQHEVDMPEAEQKQESEDDYRVHAQSSYYKENENLILEGRVTGRNHDAGLAHVRVILSTPDSLLNFNYAKTDVKGDFRLSVHDFYLDKPLYLSLDTNSLETNATLRVFDKFDILSGTQPVSFRFLPKHLAYIQSSQQYVRIAKAFEPDHVRQEAEALKAGDFRPMLYSKPNHTVKPSLFLPLNNFHEISRELLVPLRMRRTENRFQARMQKGRTAYQFFDNQPAVFLDAVPVADINHITHLKSDDIERIEMQNVHWAYGSMRFEGILAIFSTMEAYRQLKLPEHTSMIDGYSLLKPATYQPIDYSLTAEQPGRVPDLRQLLFWQPDIQLKNDKSFNANFFTGDLKGLYLIKAEGISTDGKRITAISSFIVE